MGLSVCVSVRVPRLGVVLRTFRVGVLNSVKVHLCTRPELCSLAYCRCCQVGHQELTVRATEWSGADRERIPQLLPCFCIVLQLHWVVCLFLFLTSMTFMLVFFNSFLFLSVFHEVLKMIFFVVIILTHLKVVLFGLVPVQFYCMILVNCGSILFFLCAVASIQSTSFYLKLVNMTL